MRFYSLLLLALGALAACNPDPAAGPRIDLVGSSRLLSASRSSTVPADTFTTRVFADVPDGESALLRRLSIRVEYSPSRNPYRYPATGFTPDSLPRDARPLTFLDSVLTGKQQQSVAFQFMAGTRTTSGREQWVFEAEDTDGRTRRRSFRLTLRNADSLLTYHRYSLLLPAPTSPGSRSYLALLPGLALPAFSLRRLPENQALIDLVYLPLPNGARALAAPNDPLLRTTNPLFRAGSWLAPRATELRATTLDSAAFAANDTEPELLAAFASGTALPLATRTGPLTARGREAGRVFAFRTADTRQKTGLLFIQSFPTAPAAAIRLQVRLTK